MRKCANATRHVRLKKDDVRQESTSRPRLGGAFFFARSRGERRKPPAFLPFAFCLCASSRPGFRQGVRASAPGSLPSPQPVHFSLLRPLAFPKVPAVPAAYLSIQKHTKSYGGHTKKAPEGAVIMLSTHGPPRASALPFLRIARRSDGSTSEGLAARASALPASPWLPPGRLRP